MPDFLATLTISVLDRTSIFAMMFCKCVLTVCREMPKRRSDVFRRAPGDKKSQYRQLTLA